MSSSLFTVSNLSPENFKDTNNDVFYFLYNSFMDLLSNEWKSSYYYVDELIDRTDNSSDVN